MSPILQQRTQPYVFQSFVGGYTSIDDADPLMLPKQYLSETNNCVVENGYVRKALGWLRMMNPDSFQGDAQAIYLYRTTGGYDEILFLTTTNLYEYDPHENAFLDRSPAGGLHGTTMFAPQILTWLDKVYITNGVDPIIEYEADQYATFLNQNGAPASCNSIQVFASQLFALAPTTEAGFQGWQVVWSDFRNPHIWNAGQAGGVDLDDTAEPVMAAEIIDRWMAIAKTHTWYLTTYVGPPVWFDFRRRDVDAVLARRTLIRLPAGLGLFALGPHDVIIFDGNSATPIGKPIRKELFRLLNREALDSCVAHREELHGRIYLSIATGDMKPDMSYTYSYIDGPWMRETGAVLSAVTADYDTPLLINEMVHPVDSYNVQIRDLIKSRQARFLTTDGTGLFVAGEFPNRDNQPIDAFFVTAAIAPGVQQDGTILPVTVMGILVEGNPLPGMSFVTLRASFGNADYQTFGPWQLFFDKPIQQLIPCEVSGQYFQVGIRNANLNEAFQIKQVTLRYLVRGRV